MNAKGGDEAAALRRLEDNLNSLKADFNEVKELAQGPRKRQTFARWSRCR